MRLPATLPYRLPSRPLRLLLVTGLTLGLGLGMNVCGAQATAPALPTSLPMVAVPALQPFTLVSDDEARRDAAALAAAPPPPRQRSLPVPGAPRQAPVIEVLAPSVDGAPVSSPLRIEVLFRAPSDARIVPASFRLLYGVLKIDLTERLNRNARLDEHGIVIEQAAVPQGTHRVIVRVADDKGRTAEREVVFRVAASR